MAAVAPLLDDSGLCVNLDARPLRARVTEVPGSTEVGEQRPAVAPQQAARCSCVWHGDATQLGSPRQVQVRRQRCTGGVPVAMPPVVHLVGATCVLPCNIVLAGLPHSLIQKD